MTETSPGHNETIAGQRLRLASLEACEDRIRTLRERECDLEVEHIAAKAALDSATRRLRPEIDPLLAARIGRILEQRREHAQKSRGIDVDSALHSKGDSRQRDQLRAGRAALQAWLDASKPHEPGPAARAAKLALLLATIATVWAAIAIHLAFLLLLLVVVGPVSFAMGRGQDAQWQRVGARRRFEASGLAEIATWDENAVRARLGELDVILANTNSDSAPAHADISHEFSPDAQAAARKTAEDDAQLASDLEAAGLTIDDTTGDTGEWLRLVARAEGSEESLQRAKKERMGLRAEAAEHRDELQRYLQSQGVKPTQPQDTAADIAERLDSLPGSP